MKTTIFICAFLQYVLPAFSQINKDHCLKVFHINPLVSPLTGSMVSRLYFIKNNELKRETKFVKIFPMRVCLTTMNNKAIHCIIHAVGDSSVLIASKRSKLHQALYGMKINYYDIREIKTRRKNGILKGILFGAIVGLLPVAGGAMVGQAQGGGFVSMVTLPAGIITGGIIGTSHRKYHINGNAVSFSRFKTMIQ